MEITVPATATTTTATPSIPLPARLTCRLTIKSDQPQTACRDRSAPADFVFPVEDGFRLLQARVGELFESSVAMQWSTEMVISVTMSNNAPQKDYAVLQQRPDDFRMQLERVWRMTRLRRNGQAEFVLMLFVYVPKVQEIRPTSLRRAKEGRINEQIPRVAAFIASQGIQIGPASQLYLATTQARLPEEAPIQVPTSATFRQLQCIDALDAEMRQRQVTDHEASSREYQLVRVKIQGVPVALEVNVADLRSVLGLPGYSLRPLFRPPVHIDTPDPFNDIEDTDHIDQDGNN